MLQNTFTETLLPLHDKTTDLTDTRCFSIVIIISQENAILELQADSIGQRDFVRMLKVPRYTVSDAMKWFQLLGHKRRNQGFFKNKQSTFP